MTQKFRMLTGIGLLCLTGCWSSQKPPPKSPRASAEAAPPPALSQSIYRNTKPGVAYVGDAKCADCHERLFQSYRAHPMGQSMRQIQAADRNSFDHDASPSFDAGGFSYSVSWDGERMIHSERRFDKEGSLVHERTEEVAFAVGAGSHGCSFLFQRDDSLWMSPMTWYPQRRRWALSPNYEIQNHHFTRPVLPDCLFCHSNRAHHQPQTVNLYGSPPFTGLSIGCERCHGPAEQHVQRQTSGDQVGGADDDSIVNPRKLDSVLRDGICQQCHLGGTVRVVRRGRDAYDYRPGLPWHEYMAVFVKRTQAGDLATVTSHDEQMRMSRCHQASDRKLSCISCHDPHQKPEEPQKVAYFRERCNACHQNMECNESQARRAATTPADDCLTCHMPAVASEVKHAAITDHRILRRVKPAPMSSDRVSAGGLALAPFHDDQGDPHGPEAERDLGIAMIEYASEHPERVSPEQLSEIVEMLIAAVQRDPTDFPAVEALAHALYSVNRPAEALNTVEAALRHAPRHELLLAGAALLAVEGQQWEKASEYVNRLVSLNSHQIRYRQMAVQVALGKNNLDLAVRACESVLEMNPDDRDVRQLLIETLRALQRRGDAQRHADILMRSAPARERK